MKKFISAFFDKQFLKFCLVGAANTIVGTAVMYVLRFGLDCGYWFSTAMNYVVGSILSYFLNKYFTFKSREQSWQEILRFSRRTESQINHWAARYGYKDCGEEILKEAKHGANGRYACINLTNTDTIEFRVFRGTLKYNTVIATLQFVANLCRVAISLPEYRIQEFSWPALIEALTQDNCPELVQYLKERNLYVNEPVPAEREV